MAGAPISDVFDRHSRPARDDGDVDGVGLIHTHYTARRYTYAGQRLRTGLAAAVCRQLIDLASVYRLAS